MNTIWSNIARRIVQGLNVQPGEPIQIRDRAGRLDVLLEILLTIELAGATPLPQIAPIEYIQRVWAHAPRDYLANWDHHRQAWAQQIDRVLVLEGATPDFSTVPRDAFAAWQQAVHRLTIIEEARRLPYLLVAIPAELHVQQLGLTLEALEDLLLPALAVSVEELQRENERVLAAVSDSQTIIIRSGDTHELRLQHGDRAWLSDDGVVDAADQLRGALSSNLPAGSIYTTILEDATEGSLWLPQAGDATNVMLTFEAGRIVMIEAASGADTLRAMFNRHTGESRRISHIGIGLNPYLDRPIGWTLVDEHIYGALFIALGENRYMGGQNESSLNVDYIIPHATLIVDRRQIVSEGKVVV